jgi:hypothetical protein
MSLQIWLPLVTAVVAWFVTEWRRLWWEKYQRKAKIYEDLVRASRRFLPGGGRNAERRAAFLAQAELCWLYANDDVIRKTQAFLQAIPPSAETTIREREVAYAELVLALRKDLLAWYQRGTKLKTTDYKAWWWLTNPPGGFPIAITNNQSEDMNP